MTFEQRRTLLLRTGDFLTQFVNGNLYGDKYSIELLDLVERASTINPFFTVNEVMQALRSIAFCLRESEVDTWLNNYKEELEKPVKPKNIGVIMAGNIPLVGWHDLICVIISGHNFIGKPSSDDANLTQFLANLLIELEPSLKDKIQFSERLTDIDAIIATGSNNSARYFNSYFGKYPNIIRKNRNSVAIINGEETAEDLNNLGKDIFQYFGLGCRNVSKLYVPMDYDFNFFFESIESFNKIIDHHKYANNYTYNRTILLMKQVPFLDNGFLMVKEDKSLTSPISVLNYERYENKDHLNKLIEHETENIQCFISSNETFSGSIDFGFSQFPHIWEYADGIDTMKFLLEL
jgi:acyl-CoA reductase LuxC